MRGSRFGSAVVALVGYASVVIALVWPMPARLATHLPSTGPDNLLLAWILARQSRAVTGNSYPGDGDIFHPTIDALYYGERALGALPHFLPPFLATGSPAVALGLTFLTGVVLSAWTLHLVVTRWTAMPLAGAVAGWSFLMAPWTLQTWCRQAPNYAIVQYLPLVMLWLAADRLAAGSVLALSAALVVQGLVSPYLAAAALATVAVTAGVRLASRRRRANGAALALALVGAGAVLLVGFAGFARVRLANPDLEHQTWWVFASTVTTPLADALLRPSLRYPTHVPAVCLGLIVVGFALRGHTAAVSPAAAWRQGALWAALGIVLGLDRYLRIGEHVLPSPLTWLGSEVPALDMLRAPWRLGIVALVGIAVLTGLAFAEVATRIEHGIRSARLRRAAPVMLALALGALMYREYLPRLVGRGTPLAAEAARTVFVNSQAAPLVDSPLMPLLGEAGGPLLELPIAGAESHAEAMYRAIFHGLPLLNGYSGYWPAAFVPRMAAACALPHPDAVQTLRRDTGLQLVLVHLAESRALDAAGRAPYGCATPAARAEAWRTVATRDDRPDLRLIARAGDDLLFRVTDPER